MQDETLTPAPAPAPAAEPEEEGEGAEHYATDLVARLDAIATAHVAIGGQLADIKAEILDLRAQLAGVGDGLAAEIQEIRGAMGEVMAAKKQNDKPKKPAPAPAPAKKAAPADEGNGQGAGDTGETGEHGERGKHE
jgi:hypothetical protein